MSQPATGAGQEPPADTTTTQSNAISAQPAAIKSAETSTTDTPKFAERPPGVNAAPATTAPATATTSAQPQSTDAEGPSDAYTMAAPFSLTGDDPAKKYDVQVGGVSLTSVILYVRELFGWSDTRISGEITVENAPPPGAGKDAKDANKDAKSPPAKKFANAIAFWITGIIESNGLRRMVCARCWSAASGSPSQILR